MPGRARSARRTALARYSSSLVATAAKSKWMYYTHAQLFQIQSPECIFGADTNFARDGVLMLKQLPSFPKKHLNACFQNLKHAVETKQIPRLSLVLHDHTMPSNLHPRTIRSPPWETSKTFKLLPQSSCNEPNLSWKSCATTCSTNRTKVPLFEPYSTTLKGALSFL